MGSMRPPVPVKGSHQNMAAIRGPLYLMSLCSPPPPLVDAMLHFLNMNALQSVERSLQFKFQHVSSSFQFPEIKQTTAHANCLHDSSSG